MRPSDYPYLLSENAQRMRPSPIRELFKLIQRPGMISFAGGLPDPAIFPVDEFADCASVLREHGRLALQYGATEGLRTLVDQLIARMQEPLGRSITPEQVLIGSGSQQIMEMIGMVLLDRGDVVVVEAPTYPGALHTFRNYGARFAMVPCDQDGMIVDELPQVIEHCEKFTGKRPKFIYTIINFSNPSGACLSKPRRQKLAEISARYQVPVLEDDPYGELRYQGEAIPSLCSMTESGVLFASSFSKILAPGVRVAWAVGDPPLIRKMAIAKQGMDLCTSVVSQVLVGEYCRRGHLDTHLAKIKKHYKVKAEAMSKELRALLPADAVRWADPQGGFFFWLELQNRDSDAWFKKAVEQGVAFLPGTAFYPSPDETVGPQQSGANSARLCFTFAQPDEIHEGARRLAAAL